MIEVNIKMNAYGLGNIEDIAVLRIANRGKVKNKDDVYLYDYFLQFGKNMTYENCFCGYVKHKRNQGVVKLLNKCLNNLIRKYPELSTSNIGKENK